MSTGSPTLAAPFEFEGCGFGQLADDDDPSTSAAAATATPVSLEQTVQNQSANECALFAEVPEAPVVAPSNFDFPSAPALGEGDSSAEREDVFMRDDHQQGGELESLGQEEVVSVLEHSKDHVTVRGQLLLFPWEAQRLNLLLQKQFPLTTKWSFMEVPQPKGGLVVVPSKKGNRSARRKAGGSGTSKSSSKKKMTVNKEPKPPRPFSGDLNQRVARVSQSQLKQLPEWARCLHHILVLLCQSDVVKPFVREPLLEDADYNECVRLIQPSLLPIGLKTVISKLESNSYCTSLDAFNDVYSVWLSAYRIHSPGSPLWLQAYHSSQLFFQQVANAPIKDFFAMPKSAGLISDANAAEKNRGGGGSGAVRQGPQPANVDKLLQEFLELRQEPTSKAPQQQTPLLRALPKEAIKRKSTVSRSGTKGSSRLQSGAPAPPPITDAERETFQSYLSQLKANHHLMLFEAFRKSAVWRSFESGEVELDDAKTAPAVFRRMLAWCRSQFAVQLPLLKKRKFEANSGGKVVPEGASREPLVTAATASGSSQASESQPPFLASEQGADVLEQSSEEEEESSSDDSSSSSSSSSSENEANTLTRINKFFQSA